MKKALMFAAVPAILLLSACHDTSSLTATVKSAAYALQTNNQADFNATLGGNAKSVYAHSQGADALRTRLAGKNLDVQSARLVSRGQCGNRCDSAVYYVAVMNGSALEMNVWVTCEHKTSGDPKYGYNYTNKCLITDVQ